MTAITAITAQNTVGVSAVHSIPPELILAQVRDVVADIGVDAVKIGMLGNVATIEAVAQALDELPPGIPVVLDPVMVAESGARLLDPSARAALIELLLPRATVATPNLPEARALLERSDEPLTRTSSRAPSTRSAPRGRRHGRPPRSAADVFFDGSRLSRSRASATRTAAHGSGCTHSSALAARLAWGDDPLAAARGPRRSPRGRSATGSPRSAPARARSTFSGLRRVPCWHAAPGPPAQGGRDCP